MSRSYTVMEYMGLPLAAALGGLVLILVVGIWLIPKAARRFRNPLWAFSLLLLPICAYIALVGMVLPYFAQMGDLLIPSEYVLRTSAGTIETVIEEDEFCHIHDGKIRNGEKISVAGISYYVLFEEILEEGLTISFTYAQFENNVILNWKEVTPEEAAQIRAESVVAESQNPEDKNELISSPELENLGFWLFRIGFIGLAAVALLGGWISPKLLERRLQQSASLQGEIRANKSALLEKLVPIICITVLLIGEILQTNQPFWAIFLLVPAGMLVLMAADATTVLKLDGNTFTISRWGREKTYRMEDVRGVLWRKYRGLLGHSMVLILHDGKSYWFNMDDFCGVQSVYDHISQRINEK